MLQLSFIAAMPKAYLTYGWHALSYPGDSAPLVGLTILLGLSLVATLLMIDAAFSPFGTTLVYTAATSRIVYGMALNHHIPKVFLKVNRHQIPYIALYANFIVGALSFLPFQGWQKLVAFLSSASILSYSIGPICVLAMRKLRPDIHRPFKLSYSLVMSHGAFYICNLMLYWCGFNILWKLDLALLLGLTVCLIYHRKNILTGGASLFWFVMYMASLLIISYFGSFGAGIGWLRFPYDLALILPYSLLMLYLSQALLGSWSEDSMKILIEGDCKWL